LNTAYTGKKLHQCHRKKWNRSIANPHPTTVPSRFGFRGRIGAMLSVPEIIVKYVQEHHERFAWMKIKDKDMGISFTNPTR
jgi:hypothetical protein